jgi:hypothetical protein
MEVEYGVKATPVTFDSLRYTFILWGYKIAKASKQQEDIILRYSLNEQKVRENF